MTESLNEKIPIYAVFILILIICAEYLKELIPCKLDYILKNNIYVKHFFCFLTLLFFVVITTEPFKDKNLKEIILKSIVLYILFILLIKNDYRIFFTVMVLLGFIYIIAIKQYELNDLLKKDIDITTKKEYENQINILVTVNNILFVIAITLILLGFLFYTNKKKTQYKEQFNFLTFFFGKTECKKNMNN